MPSMSKEQWRRVSILLFIALVGALVLLPPWSPLSVTTPATPEAQVPEGVNPSSVTLNGPVSRPGVGPSNALDAPTPGEPPGEPPVHGESVSSDQHSPSPAAALREPEHTPPPDTVTQVAEQDVAVEEADENPQGIAAPSPQPIALHDPDDLHSPEVEKLIEALGDSEWKVRWDAVNELGKLKDPQAIPALVEIALGDENPHPRWRSLWALRSVEPAGGESVVQLRDGLVSPDAVVVRNAAVALAFFGQSHGVDELLKALHDPDEFRRWEAVFSLKGIAGPQEFNALVVHLNPQQEPAVRVRQEVALALGNSGNVEMVEQLMEALREDSSAQVRWRAALSIGKLGDSSVVGELGRLLAAEEDSLVREHISGAIAKLENH